MAIDDMYKEMIVPFVGGKYNFSNHPHLLTFITFSSSPSSSHHHYKNDDEEGDDEDDFDSIPKSELICDGCTLSIHEMKQTSDDGEYENGYMSCDECKYSLSLVLL